VTDPDREVAGSGRLPPLLAIAHGSRDPRAAAAVTDLLGLVRGRSARQGLPGLEVVTAYLDHAPPSPAQVLAALYGSEGPAWADPAALAGPVSLADPVPLGDPVPLACRTPLASRTPRANTVIALPLLLTDAYHSKTDIPSVLRTAAATLPGLRIGYGQTLGPHPLLIKAMERRLAQAGVRVGDPDTAVVIAAAGSTDQDATAVISRLATQWHVLRGWRDVVPAFASAASPSPADAIAALRARGARTVVVASYLLAPGVFADKVRATSLAAGAAAVSGVLGAAPELADLVLRRYAASVTTTRPARQAGIPLRNLA
jgi:sirohydrochlorin ferrochelatase